VSSGPPTDLSAIADNLVLGSNGIWEAAGHQDLGFAESDPTDWLRIEQTSYWYRHRNRSFVALLEQFPPHGALFEIGAGNGTVSLAIQSAAFSVVAVEPTERWASNAKSRGVHTVVCAGLEDARFHDGALANVGMFDVLEHIDDDANFLRRLRRLMPAGGRFYCAVPAYSWLWSVEDTAAGHVRRYRLGELSRTVTAAGFTVEHATYYFAPLVIPILLLRAIPTRLGIRRARTAETSASEHRLGKGIAGRLAQSALDQEIRWLSAGRRCPVGSSCFVVARAT
jgi:SAM-dependent methyltransferase